MLIDDPAWQAIVVTGAPRARADKPARGNGRKWYQTKALGWMPERVAAGTPVPRLAGCNTNQVISMAYETGGEVEAHLQGVRVTHAAWDAVWVYRQTFVVQGRRYLEVEAVSGRGIRVGSVWCAPAATFRRIA